MSSPVVRPLPARPDLEFERKAAKQLLRDGRRGDPDALTRLRAQSRGLASSSPDAIKLADAQLAIAREYGFRSWPLLVRYYETFDRHQRSGIHRNRMGPEFYESMLRGIIAQHRDRRPQAPMLLGSFVPRFYGASVEEIFASSITEAEAQLVTARQYGCGSWAELMEAAAMEKPDSWKDAQARGSPKSVPLNEQLLGRLGMHMPPARVQQLLDAGADPSWVAPNGYTVLEHAIQRYWTGDAVDLIAVRVKPRWTYWVAAGLGDARRLRGYFDKSGKLSAAALRDRPDLTALSGHVEPSMPEPDNAMLLWEPAFAAAVNARGETFDVLLEYGFPIDFHFGMTLLAFAAGNSLLPMVELLIDRGANPEVRGWQPHMNARELAAGRLVQRPDDETLRRILMLCGGDPDRVIREHEANRQPPQPIPDLRRTLDAAAEDARRAGKSVMDVENLFVGMLRVSGMVLHPMREAGADLSRLRLRFAERLLDVPSTASNTETPLSVEVKQALDAASAHAFKRHDGIATPIVLKYLIESDDSLIAGIIHDAGGNVARVREWITTHFG